MRLPMAIAFADWNKAWDGWVGMMRALRQSCREQFATDGFLWTVLHIALGYALSLAMLTFLVGMLFLLTFARVGTIVSPLWTSSEPQHQWLPYTN